MYVCRRHWCKAFFVFEKCAEMISLSYGLKDIVIKPTPSRLHVVRSCPFYCPCHFARSRNRRILLISLFYVCILRHAIIKTVMSIETFIYYTLLPRTLEPDFGISKMVR